MNRHLIVTEDGSHSIFIPELDENYHSIHGAIIESEHVYINAGLSVCTKNKVTIFEVGFGTGLNAFLSLLYAKQKDIEIEYIAVEKYPLKPKEYNALNYAEIIDSSMKPLFLMLHQSYWEAPIKLASNFTFFKKKGDLRTMDIEGLKPFDLVFFDAFAPNKQPDLWNDTIYSKIYNQCCKDAIFVTYCASGIVRRCLQQIGFYVERIPGPPGKKEMLRAIK